ncbi:hypothetical protein V8J82_10715 [Gymnodinialimonas sp. 2305UL16-5]|uniref:hypothetical protein n=1 Tax=Gymnodinialimonas mytili TaxID=3126503 RepID=UPI00309E8ACE
MSKWINAGTMLGGASGAVAAAAAVWQLAQPGPIDSADGVVAALNGIREAIEAGNVDLTAPEVQAQVAEAAQPVAGLLARNLNALSSDEVLALGGMADAAPGESVELRLSDGSFTRITFNGWNNTPPNAVLWFEGERVITNSGWQTALGPDDSCILAFVGPTRDPEPLGRFQVTCP